MKAEQSIKSANNTNTQIITTHSGGFYRPATLLNAISEIQQFYVIESKGQNIPHEFLTLERTLDFFKIGITSGFNEGFMLVLLFPVFRFYLFPFVLQKLDIFTHLLFGSIPYMVLVINTLMCCYISHYYVGNITRKAINSLLSGRASSLLVKALLLYILYTLITRLSTPANVWKVASTIGADKAETFYYGFFTIKPHLMPVATERSLTMVGAAVIPYGSVYLLDHWRRWRIQRNTTTISGQH